MEPVLTTEPPRKKLKTENSMATIDQYIEAVKQRTKSLVTVLQDELFKPIPGIKVYIGHIKDVKGISKAIAVLNEKIPLKELSHLKRVRKKDIVLCPAHFLNGIPSIQLYIESNVEELKDMFEYFKEVDVPLTPPLLTSHLKECSKKWSCNFHPNKYLESLVDGTLFSAMENEIHRKFMVIAFEVAKWYLRDTTDFDMSCLNSAVVVDPNSNAIVATSFDDRLNHPVKHAAMLAIDNVAKTQNGGAWGESKMAVVLRGADEKLMEFLKKKYYSALTFGAKYPTNDSRPYLCTGYYIYLIREPCLMCAMALIHARVKRVFFCLQNETSGALKSVTKLQTESSLNHHFEVFTGFIE